MVITLDSGKDDLLYKYKCPFCGHKRSFINSLVFDKWIKNHHCKKGENR